MIVAVIVQGVLIGTGLIGGRGRRGSNRSDVATGLTRDGRRHLICAIAALATAHADTRQGADDVEVRSTLRDRKVKVGLRPLLAAAETSVLSVASS